MLRISAIGESYALSGAAGLSGFNATTASKLSIGISGDEISPGNPCMN